MLETSENVSEFIKWHPSRLMEYAKWGFANVRYNLACSGVPGIAKLDDLPGGPFRPELSGTNFAGHEGLKQVLAEWYGVLPENVLVAQGASQCDFLMAGAILSGGGDAIVETPTYEPPLRGTEVWANRLVRLPRRRDNGYLPDPAELRRTITTRTRLVQLTNLHNPSHVLLPDDLIREIVEIAANAGAHVLIDEVYLPFVRRDYRTHGHSLGAISVCSFGKPLGLDSLRVGWAIGPSEIVHRAYRLNNLLGVNQPFMTEDLACLIARSEAATSYLIRRANALTEQRAFLSEIFGDCASIRIVPPAGGISALIELPAGMDDMKLNQDLIVRDQTVAFPGTYFEAPGTLRVSFGGNVDETREGLMRLRRRIECHK